MGKFSTKKGNYGQHYFNLLATNGRRVHYYAAMHNGTGSVKKNVPGASTVEEE